MQKGKGFQEGWTLFKNGAGTEAGHPHLPIDNTAEKTGLAEQTALAGSQEKKEAL